MKTYKYFTIYKITNTLNNKIYIGAHATNNITDSYMGSGLHLNRAKKKYGIDNFIKDILHVFDNEFDMYDMENTLVNEEFIVDEMTYNLKVGGKNWTYETARAGYDIAVSRGFHDKSLKACKELRKDEAYVKNIVTKTAKTKMARYGTLGSDSFTGKKHTDDAKKRIGDASRQHQSGEGNSQFGTMWIYSLELRQNKKIHQGEEIPEGWIKGAVRDFDKYLVNLERKHKKKVENKTKRLEKRKKNQDMYELFNKVKSENNYSSVRELHEHLIMHELYFHSAESLRRFMNKHK